MARADPKRGAALQRSVERLQAGDPDVEQAAAGAYVAECSNGDRPRPVDPAVFLNRSYRTIVEVLGELVRQGETPVTEAVLRDELRRRDDADALRALPGVIGAGVAAALPALVARLERDHRRRLLWRATDLGRAKLSEGDLKGAEGEIRAALDMGQALEASSSSRVIGGASFALDLPEHDVPTWGHGSGEVIWPAGEPLLIVGPPGVGKTTLAQRVMLAMAGLDTHVLGFPVRPCTVLYVAADRPRQAGRSLRRMLDPSARAHLDERLLVHRGPLGYDLAREPDRLAAYAVELGVGAVVIDSLKDVAAKLSDDETGSAIVRAWNALLAADVEVAILHHQRKGQQGTKPKMLEDVYGSTWITAGAGSVVLLWGAAGDPVVDLTHLKQPAEDVGPLSIEIDHSAGAVSVSDSDDLLARLRVSVVGLTALDAARTLFATMEPTRAQIGRARRKLERLVANGLAVRREGDAERGAVRAPARYVARAPEGIEE